MSHSPVHGQSVEEIDRHALEQLSSHRNDTTYVLNFWATWCSPCVKEIGYFEELHRQTGSEKVKVILVSLDFPNQIQQRVIPFLKEKKITAQVLLMNDLDYNSWIDLIDPGWSGSLPATLIYKRENRVFLERELSQEELIKHVTQITL